MKIQPLLKPKRRKKSERQKLVDKCDKLWKQIIWEQAKYHCEYCGCESKQAHHIYTRSKFNTRWTLANGINLCPLHHTLGNFSAHKTPRAFLRWLEDLRGKEWLDRLEISSEMSGKGTDLRMVKIYLEQEIKKLN